jgi:hypothetical protein
MNRWDVEDALRHYTERPFNNTVQPNAVTAAIALAGLMEWTDDNSDGWPYWTKPSNAAKRLQEYLSGWRKRYVDGDDADLSDAELTAMLRPVKAFLTRQGADWREVLG